jgi:hypothetical protein
MKKTLLSFLVCCFAMLSAVAQPTPCTTYAAGPYGNQGTDVAGCDGQSVNTPYAVWDNELYSSELVAGATYTLTLDGCSDGTWDGPVETTVIQGGVDSGTGPGEVTDGTVLLVGEGCSFTFTAEADGIHYFIFSYTDGCDAGTNEIENGVFILTTDSGFPCPCNDDSVCDAGEDYCTCPDCDCADSVTPAYVVIDPATGTATGDPNLTIASAFCSFQMAETWNINNAEDGMLYLAIAYFGNNCPLSVTSTQGTVVDFDLAPVDLMPSAQIRFLAVSQDDIIASAGTTTITYSNPAFDNCNLDVVIDWNLIAPFADILSMVCPTGTCGANGCEPNENYCNCSTDCTCGDLLDPASVDFSGTDPVGSVANTTSALFCASDLGLDEGFLYYAVAYFGSACLDGATFNLSGTDNATFIRFDADGNPLDITDLETTTIAFVKVSLQDANGTTTVTFTNPDDSNCSTSYDINWDELLVCDNAIQPSFISFDPEANDGAGGFVSNDALNASNVFCADELDAISIAGGDPNYVYIGLGYFNLTCNTPSVSVSTEDGSIVALNADGTALEDVTEVSSANVNFLKINPAQITGAGSSTNLTYTQGACSKTQTITWSSISTTVNACIVSVPQVVASGFGISRIAPVPSNNQVQISYDMPKATTVHAQVFDMVGRAVYTQNIAANNGKNNLNLNIANFATGVYYIVLNDGTNSVMGKIVKQ